ncbi:unnamed protein product [Rodentolepis nana]|uniref:Uncharacterized protein n=1 Tax=Rodentolepis nana TaxID=102285 RepID=A0A0R3U0I4_RODNA|nr:unnamed protein product [Rodentolepis nana]
MACLRPADCRLLSDQQCCDYVFRSSSQVLRRASRFLFSSSISFQFLKVLRPKHPIVFSLASGITLDIPQGVWTKTAFFLVPQGV